ncbi:MAG: hypothetical protein RLZZ500_62 [Bacteroidota bacterium]|jgi:hypothetical protein
MKLKFTPFLLFFSLLYTLSWGQAPKKVYHTKFTTEKIVIDGKLDEATWQQAEVATDFVMVAPGNGTPEDSNRKSIIKITYTHEAIYVGALLMDDQPQTIARELTTRDDFATADHFGVILNGFNDGQQDFRFFVSAAGVQQDCVYTDSNGEDFSWNAIWDSEVRIVENGWIAEMRIPYAALRFPPTGKQTWGLNFYREVNKTRFKYTWNLIDNKINTESNQAGILEGIENIKTPTRLFFIPYSSFYLNGNSYTKTSGELKGGMDVKYGINDAFTLDAILIPDFGQTKFDNVVLNLGPFEQTFNENRPFFTEGTEMFSKGDLFYSRRIGGSPSLYENLGPDEEVVDRPNNVNLFNALKISGRTSKGLGIGVLNAVTRPMYSEIRNTVTGATRSELVEPLANYNIVVLDQRFRKNSSVSFINTSVIRNSGYRDANVSALVFDLNTKKNTYKLSGDYKYSIISQADTKNSTGYNTSLNFAETSGKYRYGFGGQYVSTFFDNNDLGVNFTTHYHSVYMNGSYRILNQTPKLNSFNIYSNNYAEFDNRTGRIQGLNHGINVNIVDKKNDYYGFGMNTRPLHVYDFYEPRTFNESRFLRLPKIVSAYFYFSSNYTRKFAIDLNPSFTQSDEKNRFTYGFQFAPRYRFSNKFALVFDYTFNHLNNNVGYVGQDDSINAIYMGRRKIDTHTVSLSGKYSINHNMTFNLVTRYYWSHAIYNNYYSLMDDGGLLNVTDSVALDADRNFNTWNCDLNFSWWFAPGSQMNILYRNKAFLQQYQNFSEQLSDNLGKVLSAQNLDHIFSISIRYFIDYNSLKKN